MDTHRRDITVIGAGVVGIACARALQRDGHRLRVLDPQPPGHGCSWGNAGVFATDSVMPLATPATLASVPGMLLQREAALSLRWRYLPRLLPWLLRFAANARPARVEALADALTALCLAADESTRMLIDGSRAAELVRWTGWLHVYETQAGLAAGRREAAEIRRRGVSCDVLDADSVRGLVPELGPRVVGGRHAPDCAMCSDPGALVERLAADIEAEGGEVVRARAHGLMCTDDGVRIDTDVGGFDAEHVVVATGIEANELARQIGDRFPLETERGYHLMIPDAGIRPRMPVMAGEHKVVTTAMDRGLRIAGLTELGGMHLPPDPRRFRGMLARVQRLFPDLRAADWTEWMGFRPTLPDSLPVIGRSPRNAHVSYAFGHQHLGLTLAALTGRLVADELAGREPVVDMTPTRPHRWLR